MKIIFDHNNGRVIDDRILCEVFCLPEGESNDELLELGWLPYPSMKIPFWYQSQSCRIDPNNISLSYKRKKIISELSYRTFEYSTNKTDVDIFFHNYFGKKSFDLLNSYNETSENTNLKVMEISHQNQIVAYVRFECFEKNILGFETAYSLDLPKLSLGKTAIILLSQEVLLRNKNYLYVYESYKEHFPYKLEISGSQYWEGEKWI
jgi:hypothetical protein